MLSGSSPAKHQSLSSQYFNIPALKHPGIYPNLLGKLTRNPPKTNPPKIHPKLIPFLVSCYINNEKL